MSTCRRGQLLVNYFAKQCTMIRNENKRKIAIYCCIMNDTKQYKSRETQFVISRLQVRFLLLAPQEKPPYLRTKSQKRRFFFMPRRGLTLREWSTFGQLSSKNCACLPLIGGTCSGLYRKKYRFLQVFRLRHNPGNRAKNDTKKDENTRRGIYKKKHRFLQVFSPPAPSPKPYKKQHKKG